MKKTYLISFIVLLTFALICTPAATYAGIAQGSDSNTKNGNNALQNNTTGTNNSAYGVEALFSNTVGSDNTAIGFQALYSNTTGINNTAVGYQALYSTVTNGFSPFGITATGYQALYSNTTGYGVVANGYQALYSNTTGFGNTAVGPQSLYSNTTGFQNVGYGSVTLFSNTTGRQNSGTGNQAMYSNTTGIRNTAMGFAALYNNTTGHGNITVGAFAGINLTTGNNNIDIGNEGVADEAGTIRIGDPALQSATFVAGIFGAATAGGIPVYVDATGQLGTLPSSQRFKNEIRPMEKASEAILSLRPVTFRYKKEIDPKSVPQFGLVAEEVAKVNPDLVARDGKGEIYSVRYEAVNAMLLNEFIKEHRQVQEQQKQIDKLTAQLKEQAALIQKVSAQVELSRPAPQVVNNQ